ncbi:MAG TPA: DoxX family protein [Alphaproteobacteria bacterium]|nr:DoxX family protein [Alphaproteobacteria bacterium]
MIQDTGLLILRLVLAIIFIVHGVSKIKHRKEMSKAMGSPHKTGFVHFLGVAEFAAAIALILGLFTTLASLGLIIVMIAAIWMKIHAWKIPFTTQSNTGWEYDLLIIAALLILIFVGPGAYSIDSLLIYY